MPDIEYIRAVIEPMRIQIHRRRGDKAQRLEAEGPPKSRDRQLPDLPSFDDLPEVCRQPAIVISKHLVKSPLALVRSLPSRLFALSSFDLVLLRFGLKIGHLPPYSSRHAQTSMRLLHTARSKRWLR